MLQLKALSKHFGSKTLFENAEANLGEKSRIALVGPNGAGKSTLIKLILGQEHYDEGEITLSPHIKIGHLAQELPKFQDRTVMDEVMRLDGRREEILAQKKDLEEKMQHLTGGKEDEAVMMAFARVLEELDALDEYRLPSRAEQILEGVGFQQKDFHRNLNELSGGWLMRVALARVLLLQPDLLILDEPTNHLDLESLLWLEEFLKNYPGAILLVSHDRLFLNRLVNEVWEIDQRKINVYSGDLDAWVLQKEERLKVLEAQFEGQQAKVAELKSFIERFGAKASKARQAQSRQKQLEKMEMIELPEDRSHVQFRFPPCPPSGREVVTLKNAGVTFSDPVLGNKTIFSNFDWILQKGSRVAIVGVNGAGKTTLLKTLAEGLQGSIPLTEGTLKLGHNVKVGYYSQLQAESLNLNWTILQELEAVAPKLEIAQVRAIAGAFLFTGDDVFKTIKVLSGGEKARVALAKLLLTPNNFLLLDEPTNHLDADSREVLMNALLNYEGTLCLVSHDRDFVAPLADKLLEIQNQKVTPLVLNYEEYLAKKIQETRDRMKRATASKPAKPSTAGMEQNAQPAQTEVKRVSNNQRRYWEKELQSIEKEIVLLEKRQGELNQLISTEDFSNAAARLKELIDEQTKIQAALDQKLSRWEELGLLL